MDFEFKITNEFYGETNTPWSIVAGWITILVLALFCIFELSRSSFEAKSRSNRRQALTDELTGLPNRRWLDEHLADIQLEEGEEFAVLFFDMDKFKEINDHHGHEIGDSVLIEVAHRLQSENQEILQAMRLSGDEFLMIGTILSDDIQSTLEGTAQSVLSSLEEPLHLEDLILNLSASVGIASSDLNSEPTKELLRRADEALYHAKGLDQVNYYYDDLSAKKGSQRHSSTSMLGDGIELRYRILRDRQRMSSGFEVCAFDTAGNEILLFEDLPEEYEFLNEFYSRLMEQAKALTLNAEFANPEIWIQAVGDNARNVIDHLVHAAEKHLVTMSQIVLVTDLETYSSRRLVEDFSRHNFENICLLDPFSDLSNLKALNDNRVKYVLLNQGLGEPGDDLIKGLIPNLSQRYDLTFVSNQGASLLPNDFTKSLYRDSELHCFKPEISRLYL